MVNGDGDDDDGFKVLVMNLRRRVVFSTAVNLVCQSVDKKSLSRVFHMMSLPWARVMVWRRMGTAIMAICEWEASRIFHIVGTMWLCCSQMNRRLCFLQVSNRT